jgi:hypothetical protein
LPDGALRERLSSLFAIDLRSLAAFRIALAALLIADLAKRALTLEAHYSDVGYLPRAVASEMLASAPWFASFHFLSGETWFQAALFVLAGAVALAMLVGYQTRLATLLSYALLLSVQFRNPMVNHTGDAYLQCLLLWSIFLPLGAQWSMDARTSKSPRASQVLSAASAALLLQIVGFYLFAGILKHDEAIWREGQALALFLHEEAYARPLAAYLLPYTELLKLGTWSALVLEGVIPVLFFCPWATARVRSALILVFTGFHLSIQLCVYIGIFEFTSILALLAFVPGSLWDAVERWRGRDVAPNSGARLSEPVWTSIVVLATGAYVLSSNLGSIGVPVPQWPGPVREVARQLRLNQHWAIFTQLDQLDSGWFAVVAQLSDGKKYEWVSGRHLADEREILVAPNDFASTYGNHNDRRWWRQIRKQRFAKFRRAHAEYYCARTFPFDVASVRTVEIRMYQVVKRVSADLKVTQPTAQRLIQHTCSVED